MNEQMNKRPHRFVFTTALLFISLHAASAHSQKNYIIEAFPAREGTAIAADGQKKYIKSFDLVLINEGHPLLMTESGQCYRAYDENGNSFAEWRVQPELLGHIDEGVETGEITFASGSRAVYRATFVRLSTDCAK
ncbi:uncharacterized protein DUF4354 [Raoultella sp. BIGb0138]|uniref:DUF4354 family protein n=1 Tax=Raoultella sp. BIGb0138 TaxID=2485115 RepID=UPI0010EC2127|nr:DUF4354 family protein [Raoultella sp. BIGb0138]TCW16765.1 uncharacterized protein DUF4354 [Raoultella sp. BIGb0138]